MSDVPDDTLLGAAPRILTDGEHELVREWAKASGNSLTAFVSQRRADDPAFFRRIVIAKRGTRRPLYLVHCPVDGEFWVVTTVVEGHEIARLPTLRAALNCVRPLLPH